MLKIRLTRVGRRNFPSFRIVVVESGRAPKSGRYLESIGFHEPLGRRSRVDAERARYWMSRGAKVSDTAHNIMVRLGTVRGAKIDVRAKKGAGRASPAEQKIAEQKTPQSEREDAVDTETLSASEMVKEEAGGN